MHARETIRPILIAKKMRRWCTIARYPLYDRNCPPARARKNFQRLVRRYPQIAAQLGLDETSIYQPI